MEYSTPVYGKYNKRPLWQWFLLYLVIGGAVYAAAYYFFAKKNGGMYATTPQNQPQYQATAPTEATTTVAAGEVTAPVVQPTSSGVLLMTKTTPAGTSYLAGPNGMTLYIFDKDTKGVSNCSGGCAQLWPPYLVAAGATTKLPTKVTVINRADGSKQYAYSGMPLYYYSPDQQPGDVTGDGVGGVWHLVKP